MTTGPKKNEYLGLIAPPGKKGLYLGYVNIPVGVGVYLGFETRRIRLRPLRRKGGAGAAYLAEHTPLARAKPGTDRWPRSERALGVSRTEAMLKLQEVTGLDAAAATQLLWETYRSAPPRLDPVRRGGLDFGLCPLDFWSHGPAMERYGRVRGGGTVGPRDHWTIGPSDDRTIGPSDHRTIGPSDHRTVGPSDRRTIGPWDCDRTLEGRATRLRSELRRGEPRARLRFKGMLHIGLV